MLGYPIQDESYYTRISKSHRLLKNSWKYLIQLDCLYALPCPGLDFGNIARRKNYFCQTSIQKNIEHYSRLTTDEQVIKAKADLEEIRKKAIKKLLFF